MNGENPMVKTISYIRCPYCNVKWVREDDTNEPVCGNCRPTVDLDLAVAQILSAIQDIQDLSIDHSDKLHHRIGAIKHAYQSLADIILLATTSE